MYLPSAMGVQPRDTCMLHPLSAAIWLLFVKIPPLGKEYNTRLYYNINPSFPSLPRSIFNPVTREILVLFLGPVVQSTMIQTGVLMIL
jgi:hypothetical protein